MNHTELIQTISERTGISYTDCDKVIRTFKDVLGEGLSQKQWKSRTFDFVLKMMKTVKTKKDTAEFSEQSH